MVFGFAVTSGVILLWMLWRVSQGTITLGDLALFYRVFDQGQRTLRGMLQHIGQLYTSSLFLSNFFEFLRLKPQVNDPVEADHRRADAEPDDPVSAGDVSLSECTAARFARF